MKPSEQRDLKAYRREQRVARWSYRIRAQVMGLVGGFDKEAALYKHISRLVRRLIRAEERRKDA